MIHMYKDQPVGGAIPFQVIPLETDEEYEALTPAQKSDPTKAYLIEEGVVMSGEIDDNDISASKAWSSQKTNNEIQAVNEDVTTINEEITDIQGDISTLNSAIATKATIKYLAVSAGNTDANGFRLIGIKGDRIPLFMDTTATNQMVHFFHANGYWYIYLTNDQNVKLANTSVSGNLYYLDKNTATPET